MRLAVLPIWLTALPLCAQWDVRLELPRATGQSLPQTFISGTGNLAGDVDTGRGFIASANRRLFQVGPLLKLEGGLEYSQFSADGTLLVNGNAAQGTRLKQQGVGVGLNAQLWVPFTGIAGEFGLIQRLQRYTFDTTGASSTKNLSRTWLRVGTRWRIPSVVVHPYVVASYQQPVTKDHPVKLSTSADLATYFTTQGSGQEFERLWTFGVGVAF